MSTVRFDPSQDGGAFRAPVAPVASGTARPLWSVMIPTYHCANHLAFTLESVLRQDPGPDLMQIEVVDDHSTQDDPETVVREIGGDRVAFYRQPENRGHTANFETCLARTRGHLVHQLHGDDGVRDGFYRTMQLRFEEHSEIGAAFVRTIMIRDDGIWESLSPIEAAKSSVLPDLLQRLAHRNRIMTPAMVVRRDVYEKLSGFDRRLSWTEDWEMWARIAAQFPVWYENEPLGLYRLNDGSNTARYALTAENIRDWRRAAELISEYLPAAEREASVRECLNNAAAYAVKTAGQLLERREFDGAFAQLREARVCRGGSLRGGIARGYERAFRAKLSQGRTGRAWKRI